MLAMFSPGPKSRTRAAYLAMFLGWTGIHKFYLGYQNAGASHVALTGVGLLLILLPLAAPQISGVVPFVAFLFALFAYYYVRRFHLGHTMAEIVRPARLLLWPWRLLSYTFRLTRAGSSMVGEEEQERRERRRWRRQWQPRGRRRRGRRDDDDDDDDDGCFSPGCIVMVVGIVLSLAIISVIIGLYIFIVLAVGFLAGIGFVVGSVVIGVVEGWRYFGKTEDEFQQEYVAGRRPWF